MKASIPREDEEWLSDLLNEAGGNPYDDPPDPVTLEDLHNELETINFYVQGNNERLREISWFLGVITILLIAAVSRYFGVF